MNFEVWNLKNVIQAQRSYWERLNKQPNGLLLGIEIIKILDKNGLLTKEIEWEMEVFYYEDLKIYVNEYDIAGIAVLYCPFDRGEYWQENEMDMSLIIDEEEKIIWIDEFGNVVDPPAETSAESVEE
jgi:hypothetical protein